MKKAKNDLLSEGLLENLPGRKGVFVKQSSRTLSKGLVGVAIDDVNDLHFVPILKGIEDKLWENKLHTICAMLRMILRKWKPIFVRWSDNRSPVLFLPLPEAPDILRITAGF